VKGVTLLCVLVAHHLQLQSFSKVGHSADDHLLVTMMRAPGVTPFETPLRRFTSTYCPQTRREPEAM